MKQQALSLYEFQKRYPDETACRRHLFQQRWPDGFVCPRCHHTKYYTIKTRHLYECSRCHYQTSVTAGTIFHKTHIPLHIWFWVIFLVAKDKRGISALQISKEFPISYPTAWTMLQKIRTAMAQRDSQYLLDGLIEVDDAYFGGPTSGGKRGRGTEKASVLVSLSVTDEGKPQFAKMQPVPDLTVDTIDDQITDQTTPSSRIHSDAFSSYKALTSRDHEWVQAYTVDLKKTFKWVHTLISNTKAFIAGTYHGLGEKHLQAYLSEYCYRFNRRFYQAQLFDRLLFACVNAKPVTYAELT